MKKKYINNMAIIILEFCSVFTYIASGVKSL